MRRALAVTAALMLVLPAGASAHGHRHRDPAGAFRAAALLHAADGLPTTWCGTERSTDDTEHAASNGADVKVIYAYPSDKADRFDAVKNTLQATVARASDIVRDSSGGALDIRWDTGTSCGADYVDIATLKLPGTLAQYQSGDAEGINTTVQRAFGRQPYTAQEALGEPTQRNYAVFVDHWSPGGIAGIAESPSDETKSFFNGAHRGRWTALVFASSLADPEVLLHEVSHTLGAVNQNSPHSSGVGHCWDEADVMCYADGGTHPLADVCPMSSLTLEQWDCGHDDYFNTAPPAGTYLATHWNLADSLFMCPASRCRSRHSGPPLTLVPPDHPLETGRPETFKVTVGAGDPVTHITWHSLTETWETGTQWTHTFSSGGYPATIAVRAWTADGVYSEAKVTLPVNRPPGVRIHGDEPAGAARPFTLYPGGDTTTHGGLDHWRWDFKDGTPPVVSSAVSVDHAFPSTGTFDVELTAFYKDGATGSATRRYVVTRPPNRPPVARLTGPSSGEANTAVSFDAGGSSDDGTIKTYAWDFGDGVRHSVGATARHYYQAAGSYTVTVTLTDDEGATSSAAIPITVTPQRLASDRPVVQGQPLYTLTLGPTPAKLSRGRVRKGFVVRATVSSPVPGLTWPGTVTIQLVCGATPLARGLGTGAVIVKATRSGLKWLKKRKPLKRCAIVATGAGGRVKRPVKIAAR